jgi:hypothetical protein
MRMRDIYDIRGRRLIRYPPRTGGILLLSLALRVELAFVRPVLFIFIIIINSLIV